MNERSFTGWDLMSDSDVTDKRQQILTAAEKLVAEFGVQGFSMHKLADCAGVATGTLYRYFDDKNTLLAEVRFSVMQRIALAAQAGVHDGMPLKLRFRTMWLNIWQFANANVGTISNRLQYASLPSLPYATTKEREWQIFTEMRKLFNEGKEQGLFKPLDNEILAVLSFEASAALARKHSLGFYELDSSLLDAALEACWDAIITH